MVACGALLVVAGAAAWRWRRCALELPGWAERDDGRTAVPARAVAWLLAVGMLTGLLVGVLVVGPAGRLAMRLLAETSPDGRGRITEADQVVGQISLDGTIALFVFAGLPFGLAVGMLYVVASFLVPRGVAGGAILGAALLVVFGSTVDPLREANPDFEIVGPGWLSVTTFCVMSVLTGILTAPLAGRVGAVLGTPRVWWLAWMLPAGLVTVAALALVPVALAAVVIGCLVFVGALVVPPPRREVVWRRGRRVLQVVLGAAVAITAPGFVSAVATIIV